MVVRFSSRCLDGVHEFVRAFVREYAISRAGVRACAECCAVKIVRGGSLIHVCLHIVHWFCACHGACLCCCVFSCMWRRISASFCLSSWTCMKFSLSFFSAQ